MTLSRTTAAPIIAQSDGTLLLDERLPGFGEAQALLRAIAELQKRPGHLHTYRITPVTVWNAAASGWTAARALGSLRVLSRYGVPAALERDLAAQFARYGQLRLGLHEGELRLRAKDPALLAAVASLKAVSGWLRLSADGGYAVVRADARGWLKRELALAGYPVIDDAGYRSGEPLPLALCHSGAAPALRDYQQAAVDALLGRAASTASAAETSSDAGVDVARSVSGGSGVVVLPCGAGKTWVGIGAVARLACETLILTPNTVSVTQWIRELRRATTLGDEQIGAYTGERKEVRPVTVATYQVLTSRGGEGGGNAHWRLFQDRNWGLIIYDEVHLLPAPVFRLTAELQATRRLGLTATLVREDGREKDVFALVGPKAYEAPWKSLEEAGWIAEASCSEVRVPLDAECAGRYAVATARARSRIAGENPRKAEVVRALLARHEGEQALVIGQYLDQLRSMSRELGLPLVTGDMPHRERQDLFDRFNRGELRALALSKVANFAVDLPDAAVAVQISGSFGSRQEEAQRLGRILRPKKNGEAAFFYSLVSEHTDEVEYARRRQQFLIQQGYRYEVGRWAGAEGAAEAPVKEGLR
ncbi:DNA repair helicase XPB [Cohnella hashimotonis]|uniref:DNA 3'-5' helicase n=1 Tax=Cohnella hashimotonis TaxID=2826895 RepID=A0ABT6TIB8_9BACL|nr:DNA repair helicase XPB [Cohnella hashimotonis]MDI4646454.1 DEAD/DEAH box helicase [Cohnella hashimotonis]